MKKIKLTTFNNSEGFTLVELMIAVAIIGVLAAVTVPNFKKYQAKSKTIEAKIQLAAVYTAETSFYQLFDMYASCLDYMGYDPTREANARYYAIGFPNITANIDAVFHASAVGERLVNSACPRDLGEISGKSIFLAGKSIGNDMIDTLAKFQAAASINSNILDDGIGPFSEEVHSGLGVQLTEDNKVFTVAAIGYIDPSSVTPASASIWTINQNKKISNHNSGY